MRCEQTLVVVGIRVDYLILPILSGCTIIDIQDGTTILMLDKVITAVAFARVIVGALFVRKVRIVYRLIANLSDGPRKCVGIGLTVNGDLLASYCPLAVFPSPTGMVG